MVAQGVIPNHELLFRGYKSSAVATVEPKQGENVPVLIWDIGAEDEYYLDRYEGYPRLYGKQDIEVQTESGTEQIMVYLMTEGHEIGNPSQGYLNTIATGYLEAGFDINYLANSVEKCRTMVNEKEALEFAAYRREQRQTLVEETDIPAGGETAEKENAEESQTETEQEGCSWQIQQP